MQNLSLKCKKCCSRKKSLHGAWIESNGKQYVCDSHRIFEINNPIELSEVEIHPHATKYYNIISNAKNDNTYIIEIPPLQDMKEQIKSLKKIKVMIIEFLLILEKINLQLMLNICFKCWKHWEK